jgi:hypothetical protein
VEFPDQAKLKTWVLSLATECLPDQEGSRRFYSARAAGTFLVPSDLLDTGLRNWSQYRSISRVEDRRGKWLAHWGGISFLRRHFGSQGRILLGESLSLTAQDGKNFTKLNAASGGEGGGRFESKLQKVSLAICELHFVCSSSSEWSASSKSAKSSRFSGSDRIVQENTPGPGV